MLITLAIKNYRSLRNLVLPLSQLNVITGANGSGKSSIYRALCLLSGAANGTLTSILSDEGGLSSTSWAGPDISSTAARYGLNFLQAPNETTNLCLGFATEHFGYSIDLGLPDSQLFTAFKLDPEIKREIIWNGTVFRPASLLIDRVGTSIMIRTPSNSETWLPINNNLASFDSMLTEFVDPRSAPEMLFVREQIRTWRFYDQLRADSEAPVRLPQTGTHSPVLSKDGKNLAATLQTIREIGDADTLNNAIEDAFPNSKIEIAQNKNRFEILMHQDGLLRPLTALELSESTLRYLLYTAALLSPRPPTILVLNKPETSLHPDLLPALGRLIAQTAAHTQIIVFSQAQTLISMLEHEIDCNFIHLEKRSGETIAKDMEHPEWQWLNSHSLA